MSMSSFMRLSAFPSMLFRVSESSGDSASAIAHRKGQTNPPAASRTSPNTCLIDDGQDQDVAVTKRILTMTNQVTGVRGTRVAVPGAICS